MNFEATQDYARRLDTKDPLRDVRHSFYIPEDTIYMDGNSLGVLSVETERRVQETLEEWKNLGIKGWLQGNPPWFYYAEEVGKKAAPLAGAKPGEVVATGGTTVNIHALLAAFYHPEGKRTKILADALNFPSDIYAIKGFLKLKGYDPEQHLVLVRSRDGHQLAGEDIMAAMNDEVAVALLPTVLYRSGQLLNIPQLTQKAHEHGILIGFDASHSAGAVPHRFHKDGVDFAMWCGYKYLNGGPGSTGFLYVRENHFYREPLLAGWFGYQKDKQFDMSLEFHHAQSAGGWQISTPNILSLAAMDAALDVMNKAGIEAIRAKSLQQTAYLQYLIGQKIPEAAYGFRLQSPHDPAMRSSHMAVEHPQEAWRINKALQAHGVVPDFRHPNLIRLAPVALYNTYEEIYRVVELMRQIMDQKEYQQYDKQIAAVS